MTTTTTTTMTTTTRKKPPSKELPNNTLWSVSNSVTPLRVTSTCCSAPCSLWNPKPRLAGSGLKTTGRRNENNQEAEDMIAMRAACADAMLAAAKSMGQNRHKLWKRGVPDETVVVLPCRIAYQMLEFATGILARKAASGDTALAIIAATVDSCDALLGTTLAALMDMLHSYEHMASVCAELCCMVSEKPTNQLAIELIREVDNEDSVRTFPFRLITLDHY